MFRPVSVIIRFLHSLLKSVTYCLNRVVMLRSHHRCEVLYTILWDWMLVWLFVCGCRGFEGNSGLWGMTHLRQTTFNTNISWCNRYINCLSMAINNELLEL